MTLGKYRTTLLIIGDLTALWAGLLFTLILRYGLEEFKNALDLHALPFGILFCLWLIVFYVAGLYNISSARDVQSLIQALIYAVLLGGIVSVALFYFAPIFVITPKLSLLVTIGFSTIFLFWWRLFFARSIRSSSKMGVLLFGSSGDLNELASTIKQYPELGYHILAHIPEIPPNITEIIETHRPHIVVATRDTQSNPELVHALYNSLQRGIRFIDAADFFERVLGKIPVSLISKVWFLENIAETEKNFFESAKRGVDIFLALSLGIITVPLHPFIALLVKATSKGPVLIWQTRVGKFGKIYRHCKYRTMVALSSDGLAEESGAVWSPKNDTRITRVGKILRATRIDELPQLWNVLKGELSFIGPRPERPEFVESLRKEIPFYDMRHLVRPGLSGWAQTNPPYYYASVDDTILKLQYDLYYIKNRNIVLDLAIALKTLMVILSRKGR